jgi:integrase
MKDFEDTFYGRPNTISTYKSLYRGHIKNKFDNYDWQSWNEDSTSYTIKAWEEEGLSRNTKIALIRLLARYIKFMGGPDIDTQKFVRSLRRSEQQTEVTALSPKEAQRLIETTRTQDPKFFPVMLLALHAGLRRGEIFGLKCADIDMLQGKIKVSHSYAGPTKNGRSRLVPMSTELAKALPEARNLMLRSSSELIFESFDPNPTLRKLCRKAKVPTLRFHDLRHSFASMALTSGISPKQVAAWLGHSSVSTTLNIYWNLTSEEADMSFLN